MDGNKPVKGARWKRWIIRIIEFILLLSAGGAAGYFLDGWLILLAAVVLALVIMGLFHFLRTRKFPELYEKPEAECEAKPKVSTPKKVITTILYVIMGASFTFGAVSVIMLLIRGYEGSYTLYIGAIVLAVVIFVVMLAVPPLRDPEVEKELEAVKKEMRYIEKDERVIANKRKAGAYTLWTALALLLISGAAITVFPVENINIITGGILGLCAVAFIIYSVLLAIYEGDKDKGETPGKNEIRNCTILFILSLPPLIFMGVWWILRGLMTMGIAFFAAFAVVSVVLLIDIVVRARLARKG